MPFVRAFAVVFGCVDRGCMTNGVVLVLNADRWPSLRACVRCVVGCWCFWRRCVRALGAICGSWLWFWWLWLLVCWSLRRVVGGNRGLVDVVCWVYDGCLWLVEVL